jgi:hypothetical protein
MIQRVQSLFLLLVVILSVVLFMGLPVLVRMPSATEVGLSQSAILQIMNAATGILAFVAIFLFKRRNLQIRAASLGMLITCVLIALLFFMSDTMAAPDETIHYKAGSYLPLLQLLFLFIAIRFIKKDEELVRSADRLR